MNSEKQKELLERIPHITNSSPYSIHKTDFTKENLPALYLHFHPEIEFLYLQEGSLEVVIHNTSYRLQKGEALFIPPNLLHTAHALSESGTFYAIVFSEELFTLNEHPLGIHNKLPLVLPIRPSVDWQQDILFYLERLFSNHKDFAQSDSYITSHITILKEYLLKHHLTTIKPVLKEKEYLQKIIDFIHANYDEDISLDRLTKIAHMSKEHLCRTFKQATGYTPFAYLKYYRILKSCHYLKNTDKKVSEICALCGFNNISYFNREFLQTMQTTPLRYRNNT